MWNVAGSVVAAELARRAFRQILSSTMSSQSVLLVFSVHRGSDVPPDRVLGIDMPAGSPNEKKKDRSKNKQAKSQVTPAVQQVHVVLRVDLWDDPPKDNSQKEDENDSDAYVGHA